MATTKSVSLTLETVSESGKKSSQTFKNVNPDATLSDCSDTLDIVGGMKSDTPGNKYRNVKEQMA